MLEIIPNERVSEIYPKGSSYEAKLANKAIDCGYQLAVIKTDRFNKDILMAIQVCERIVGDMLKCVIDLTNLEKNEVVVVVKK